MERKQDITNKALWIIVGLMLFFSANLAVGQNFYPNNRLDYYNMDTTDALAEKPDYSWINPIIGDLYNSILRGNKVEVPQFPKETFYNPTLIIPLVQLRDTQIQHILSEMICLTKENHLAAYQDSISRGIFADVSFSMGDLVEYLDSIDDYPQLDIHVRSNLHMMAPVIEYKRQTDSLFAFYQDSILCVVNCSAKVMDFLDAYFSKAFECSGENIKIHCCGRSTFYYSSQLVDSMEAGKIVTIHIPVDGMNWSYYWKDNMWNDTAPYKTYRLREIFMKKRNQ